MTDRWQIRGVPIPLRVAALLALPDHSHTIRFMVVGEGNISVATEIELEGHRCIDRENDTWQIDGKIVFCGDPTKFKESDKVRATVSHRKQRGEIRKLQVLSAGALASVVKELGTTEPQDLPDD